MEHTKKQLIQLIREKSYEKKSVTLSSGLQSDFYVDMKQTLLHAQGISWVAQLMLELLKPYLGKIKGVGGLTMGADPLATAVSLMSLQTAYPVHAFYIRKEPKGHGTNQWVEGIKNYTPGDKVFILEDVVTTGGSSLKAVERARLAELDVVGIITCVDRQEGGRETIEKQGLKLLSLVTKAEIVNN